MAAGRLARGGALARRTAGLLAGGADLSAQAGGASLLGRGSGVSARAAGLLAMALLLCLAAQGFADERAGLDYVAATGGAAPPARNEALVLGSEVVSLAGKLKVGLDSPGGLSLSALNVEPDRKRFFHLPVNRFDGVGASLRSAPLGQSVLWLAFSLRSGHGSDAWALVADGAAFKPSALVFVDEDGGRSLYSGDTLAGRRVDTLKSDLSAYLLDLPPEKPLTVYLRLEPGSTLGRSLGLWPLPLLKRQLELVSVISGTLAGFAISLSLTYALFIVAALRLGGTQSGETWPRSGSGRRKRHPGMVLGLAYPLFACVSIVMGRHGGGVSALLAGQGAARYLTSVALAALAILSEAALACMRAAARPGWRAGTRSLARLALPRLAFAAISGFFAFSTRSTFASFALPLGLVLHIGSSGIAEVAWLVRRARASMAEAGRQLSELDLEARGGRDFLTATAAALRGPLHGLLGILDNLALAISQPQAISREALSDISFARAEAIRLDNLVSNILSYSGMGPPRLTPEDFDLASLARSVAGLLRVTLAGRNIRIEIEAPITELRLDLGVTHRLLYTTLNRAARTGGVKTVRLDIQSDERVVVYVRDDGLDPAATDMETVVLGRLASLSGGTFEYRREAGSNIHIIELPRSAPARVDDSGAGESRAYRLEAWPLGEVEAPDFGPAPGAAGRVLVIGNEPVALIATRRRLEASGWSVETTVSSAAALDRVLAGQPCDIVIIDSNMPELDAFDFCRALRAGRGTELVPIIVLTEAGRSDEIERAFRSGANDYIVRPASGIELAARVKTHVDLASSIRRELEQAARFAEFDKYRTLAMLSAGIAHEINTPNNAVLRNVPMLKEIWQALDGVIDRLHREEGGFSVRGFGYEDLKSDIPDILNDLYMGAQDIKKIVEGLKDYVRAPSDLPDLPLVEVNECIRYASRLLKHTIAVSTEHFELGLAESLPAVRADRLKLTQVIVNVLENAIQSLPDGKGGVRVDTGTEIRDGTVSVFIRVSDEGIGMTDEILSNVFEPFFTTKRERGGSGLGLAVVSGILRDMGGGMELVSRPGNGTVATIRLPASSAAQPSLAALSSPVAQALPETKPALPGNQK